MGEPAVEWFIGLRRDGDDEAVPRRTWVYRQVLDAIRSGRLPAGTRLPSARRLALAWDVARGAVDDAFAQLQSEGLIQRRVGNGSFVAPRLRGGTLTAAPAETPAPPDATTCRAIERLQPLALHAPVAVSGQSGRLHPGLPDTAGFPLAAWRREIGRAFAETERNQLSYGVPAGLPALRSATARHLSLTRSIECRPDQVLIVASPLHAIELVAQVLLEPGDAVCVDDPGAAGVARLLALAQLDVIGVPVDEQGFDVDQARRRAPNAAAVLLQPLNQWPTGQRTTVARQRALLDWADACGAWVVENDTLGEIVHDGAAPPALQRLDRAGRVLYVGSFSTLTFPSLRLAYLVLPEGLVDVFAAVRGLMGDHSPAATQAALATFIEGGHLSAHLRALRRLYRARRDALLQAVQRHLPAAARLGPTGGGTWASLQLPAAWSDAKLVAALAAQGIAAEALSRLTWQAPGLNGLLLGYGADDERAIDAAVATIASVLPAR